MKTDVNINRLLCEGIHTNQPKHTGVSVLHPRCIRGWQRCPLPSPHHCTGGAWIVVQPVIKTCGCSLYQNCSTPDKCAFPHSGKQLQELKGTTLHRATTCDHSLSASCHAIFFFDCSLSQMCLSACSHTLLSVAV